MDLNKVVETADFMVKYGFLGVGLALIFLVAPGVYRIWTAKIITLGTACVGITFIVAFGVIDMLQKHAPQWLSSQRPIVSGTIRALRQGFQLSMQSDIDEVGQAYTKRVNDEANKSLHHIKFMLVTRDVPKCLAIDYSSMDPNAEKTYRFNLTPILKEDMSPNVELVGKLLEDKDDYQLEVWRTRDERRIDPPMTLDSLKQDSRSCGVGKHQPRGTLRWPIISSAFAQSTRDTTLEDWIARLRSDDSFTRQDTRIELSEQGTNGLEVIEQLLHRNEYRIQLGAIAALSVMPVDIKRQAKPNLLAKVQILTKHSDKTMRDTALRALIGSSCSYGTGVCSLTQLNQIDSPCNCPGASQDQPRPGRIVREATSAWIYHIHWCTNNPKNAEAAASIKAELQKSQPRSVEIKPWLPEENAQPGYGVTGLQVRYGGENDVQAAFVESVLRPSLNRQPSVIKVRSNIPNYIGVFVCD